MMTLFVDQSTGKITTNVINAVPIKIETDIVLFDTEKSNVSVHEMKDDKYLYIDENNQETTESQTVKQCDELDYSQTHAFGLKSFLDEKMYESSTTYNTPKITKASLLHDVIINEDNACNYSIEDILDKDFSNILENSNYDKCIYNLLEDIILDTSSYVNYNKYRLIMEKDDIVYMSIPNITTESKIIIRNIPDGIQVYINDSLVSKDSNNDLYVNLSLDNMNLNIELVNKNSYNVSLINPYILYS